MNLGLATHCNMDNGLHMDDAMVFISAMVELL
jgi:hypothetical protein